MEQSDGLNAVNPDGSTKWICEDYGTSGRLSIDGTMYFYSNSGNPYAYANVPEPSSFVLLACGFGWLLIAVRRTRRS